MSSNENIFHIIGPLCREFTSHRWIPHTKASDAEFWYFLWSAPEQMAEWTTNILVIWWHHTHYDVTVLRIWKQRQFCSHHIHRNILISLRIYKNWYNLIPWLHHDMETLSTITGPLWGESTIHQRIPLSTASDAELWCFHKIFFSPPHRFTYWWDVIFFSLLKLTQYSISSQIHLFSTNRWMFILTGYAAHPLGRLFQFQLILVTTC